MVRFFKRILEWAEHVHFLQGVARWLVEYFGVQSAWGWVVSGGLTIGAGAVGLSSALDPIGIFIVALFAFAACTFTLNQVEGWRSSRRAATTPSDKLPSDGGAAMPDYLGDTDSELTLAVFLAASKSALGKWQRSQPGGTKDGEVETYGHVMNRLSSDVLDKAMNGALEIRGRLPNQVAYTLIPKETWRLAFLNVVSDPIVIWKVKAAPRANVDSDRIREVLSYDSLLVDSRQFEALYPSKQNW